MLELSSKLPARTGRSSNKSHRQTKATTSKLTRPIALVGFMASGKSSIGKLLAKRLKLEFIDLDQEIEALANMSISQIFKSEGEVAFRAFERGTLREILGRANQDFVLATGGGTFVDQTMRENLLKGSTTVFLEASLETILARLNEDELDCILNWNYWFNKIPFNILGG